MLSCLTELRSDKPIFLNQPDRGLSGQANFTIAVFGLQ